MSNNKEQKFRLIIDFDITDDRCDINLHARNLMRNEYIDTDALRKKLLGLFAHLQTDGMDSLLEQANIQQMH